MIVKRIAALVLALLLLAPAAAYAAEADEPIPDEDRFGGKDWDAVVEEFLSRRGVNTSRIGIAYYNTVTGEEHFLNGDVYRYAASVYKLPLNMIYAERVYNGEMDMDEPISGLPYRDMQRLSLELSSNSISELLCTHLGTRQQYCEAMAAMLADDPADLGEDFIFRCYTNDLTPAQLLYALKKLYAAPDRYPDVLEHMLVAQQDEYFCMTERRYRIAHKYGCLISEEDGSVTVNDCGIVYTDDPFLLVMFTGSLPGAFTLMADFCTLMCDYTQYTRAVRLRAEAAAAEAEAAGEQARLAQAAAEAEAAAAAAEQERARLEAEAAQAAAEAEKERAGCEAEAAPWVPDAAGDRFLKAAGASLLLCLIAAPIFWRAPEIYQESEDDEPCDAEND